MRATTAAAEEVQIELATKYFSWVRSGTKTLTVRLGKLCYPLGPAVFVDDNGNRCEIELLRVEYATFRRLTEEHARADGFENLLALQRALHGHYPAIRPDDEVTLLHFKVASRPESLALFPLEEVDMKVVEAAQDIIRRNFDSTAERHTVGAAVLAVSGKIYSAVNMYANCGVGACADILCLGTAISAGEREFVSFCAAGGPNRSFGVMPPCGNCRQVLLEYAPALHVIVPTDAGLKKALIEDLLPFTYRMQFGQGA